MSTFDDLGPLLLDGERLIRAVGSGRQRGQEPRWRRAEVRYVDLAVGRRLQITSYDDTQAFTTNHEDTAAAVAELAAEPFANWHVETTEATHQMRVTKKGKVLAHRSAPGTERVADRAHDRVKERLIPAEAPVLKALGISDAQGRIKPSRMAKYRQVEDFLRALDDALEDAWTSGALRRPDAQNPLRIVDLGCGNAYLTLAAVALLHEQRGIPVHVTGVDVKEQARGHNSEVATSLGWADVTSWVVGTIGDVVLEAAPEVVLALHACDTATDDALAQALRWEAPLALAAPCCHHDIATQLRGADLPAAQGLLVRDGILRERLADTLTDALRAELLRHKGYRVDVIEFVASAHTPRNTLLRAVRTGVQASRSAYDDLTSAWQLHPRLAALLEDS